MFKLVLVFLVIFPLLVSAQTWQAKSTDKQLPVVELFTSEGCGSCPPADRWAKNLPNIDLGIDKVVVLGFHIDYLNDRKGWICSGQVNLAVE